MHELEFATIEALSALLAKKKLSPVELTELYLSRIARINPKLNAFLTVASESALAEARAAERELLRGQHRGALHGIPVALKDNIWTRNLRTTVGSFILRDFLPSEDATVVRKLRRAGAIVLGKTNLHEFAYGVTSENPHYGPVRNPWKTDRIAGGSSGGSAAAVAAGLCAAAIGSDTGGSIRIPSALCGVVGFKPTFGWVSVHGVFPLAPSFDHVGPIVRSARDAALVLECIVGRDPLDPTSRARSRQDFQPAPKRKRLRLGRPKEHFWVNMDSEVRRIAEVAIADFVKSGAELEEISLPNLTAGVEAANLIAAVEANREHQRAGYFPARASEYGPDVRGRLEQGGETRAVDYLNAQEVMRRASDEVETALENVEAIVIPTALIAAPPIGSERVRVGDVEMPIRSVFVDVNRPGNFTGLPAISMPCGVTQSGLPTALQFLGRRFDDARLIAIAHRFSETERDWQPKHPPAS
ncbi:MAG: Asp-tRNA(Asn)/Glu-tRNA(Gln) amidotransferase subunit GatA [Acidobacteria bacterium]|nr:MAG: Asp-tRNA(Asn)/Glu-tRNA(Gln) amidotransferase subunit GatA [Acidobacteriota bacterium]